MLTESRAKNDKIVLQNEILRLKNKNFALKMMILRFFKFKRERLSQKRGILFFILKMINYVLKMMNYALEMMNSVLKMIT